MKASPLVRAVTFDAAGTLFFPWPSVGAIYSEVMARFGLKLEPERLDSSFAKAFKSATKNGRIEDPEKREWVFWRSIVMRVIDELAKAPSDFDPLFQALWTEFSKGSRWKLNPDALAIFDFLEHRKISFALLTNWDQRVRRVVKEHKLESRFTQLFISSEVGFEKPERQLFDFVATEMKRPPHEMLHIGDHLKQDYHGARDSGWNALLLSSKGERDLGARTIHRLLDMRQHIQ